MKKTALFLALVIIVGCCVALISCNNKPQNSTTQDTTSPTCLHDWEKATRTTPKTWKKCVKPEGEPLSAYEVLNEDEKSVYNTLKNYSSKLGDPTSLKLLGIYLHNIGKGDKIYVKISGSNAYGSTVSQFHYINDDGTLGSAPLLPFESDGKNWKHVDSVPKINAALKEYFDSMGW